MNPENGFSKERRYVFLYVSWPRNWIGMVNLVESFIHDIKITPIRWSKAPNQWFELNSDGSALSNGKIGTGGVSRNKKGDLILAYSTPLDDGSNN